MTKFQLQPGDYIRTACVPDDKKKSVIDAFVKAGAKPHRNIESYWDMRALIFGKKHLYFGLETNSDARREVTLDQILGKPMLIEALKPGMRAKVCDFVVTRTDNEIRAEKDITSWSVTDVSTLTTTDYEIIPADPVPWKACEQAAKIMKVINAICNMPGYGGSGAHVFWLYVHGYFGCAHDGNKDASFMDYPFDTYENAKAAADYANKLIV